MPPIRDHDVVHEDVPEEDGMPPLVDNPNPSMTYTFFTNMTPITFSSDGRVATELTGPNFNPASTDTSLSPITFGSTPPTSPVIPDELQASTSAGRGSRPGSHGKKRDASYIPRPPNAFILFRSSFIRSQQVPGKVEGNHSTLSKIIGMYWKTLPKEEREQWEAKAVIAQAEHRKRYPDWRFRPGANAMAKLKTKDGGGGTSKRRNAGGGGEMLSMKQVNFGAEGVGKKGKPREGPVIVTDVADAVTNDRNQDSRSKVERGKGKEREKDFDKRDKLQDERCAKITDLLVEGKRGAELGLAIEEWEGTIRKARRKERREAKNTTSITPRDSEVATAEAGAADSMTVPSVPAEGSETATSYDAVTQADDVGDNDVEDGGSSGTEKGSGGTADAEGEDYFSGEELSYTSSHMRTHSTSSFHRSPDPNTTSAIAAWAPQNEANSIELSSSGDVSQAQARRSNSPNRAIAEKFKIPLTSMFKRSLSAPASDKRISLSLTRPKRAIRTRSAGEQLPGGGRYKVPKVDHQPQSGVRQQVHVRRDTISLPVDEADFVHSVSPTATQRTPSPQRSTLSESIKDSQLQPSQPEITQSEPLGTVAHPLTLHWHEDEDRRRFVNEHGDWWPAPSHTVASHDSQTQSYETSVNPMLWQSVYQPGSDGLGYEYPTNEGEYARQSSVSHTPSGDGSDVVDWMSPSDRAGLVASISDPYITYFAPRGSPAQPSLQTNVSSHPNSACRPTSPMSATSISSFSTLTGWAGETFASPKVPVAPSFAQTASQSPVMSASNSAWYQPSGWNTQLQPLNIHGAEDKDSDDVNLGSSGSSASADIYVGQEDVSSDKEKGCARPC